MSERPEHWYQQAVLYHIYPLSFADSNGDGFGDLPGIIGKLDYLKDLGVDAVWLSPIYPSPMVDWGYDVSDYCGVDPRLGTMADLEQLVSELHSRSMRLLLDFVPGHTSTEHPWFKEASSSIHNAKRDWYIWADGKDGSPPNNWLSRFGGPAWELDEASGQYYLHTFFSEQADLNWRSPGVREAMLDVLRFWVGKGIDGFRTDAVIGLVKDADLRDDPPNPEYRPGIDDPTHRFRRINSAGQEELGQVINRFCDVLGEKGDELLVSEAYLGIPGMSQLYRACKTHPVHAPFNFNLMRLPWSAEAIGDFIEQYDSVLQPNDLPNWVLGNHDKPRLASRLGQDKARLMSFLQLTLRGMPVIYYGDELGTENAKVPEDQVRDLFGRRVPGFNLGRDPERAPMAWDSSHNGGFTSARPWLPLPAGQHGRNAEDQSDDPNSMLQLYRRLLSLRKSYPVLATGEFRLEPSDSEDVLVFRRGKGEEALQVALNFAEAPQSAPLEKGWHLLASTHKHKRDGLLEPYEGRLYARKVNP